MLRRALTQRQYSSTGNDLFREFYLPALSASTAYDRAVGYFSPLVLAYAAQGIESLVLRGGCMRLIIGEELDDAEYEAILRGSRSRPSVERLIEVFASRSKFPKIDEYRLALLAELTAAEALTVKIALRPHGMYHEKIGIFRDPANAVAFSGSANETMYGLHSNRNSERISVYPSWDETVFRDYGQPIRDAFELLWNGNDPNNITLSITGEEYALLRDTISMKRTTPLSLGGEERLYQAVEHSETDESGPALPVGIELHGHQKEALNAWIANRYGGILALSTGSGKTISALAAAARVARHRSQSSLPTFVIIAVPFIILAEQWRDVMGQFGFRPFSCFGGSAGWRSQLDEAISNACLFDNGSIVSAIVVNRTLSSSVFQEQLARIPAAALFFVGDECHRHGTASMSKSLPKAAYRMGLSATPWSRSPFDEDRRLLLEAYYGEIVAKYDIQKALSDGVLTPYRYHIITCQLTATELDQYEEISAEIAKMLAFLEHERGADRTHLNILLSRRARLIGSAEVKFQQLAEQVSALDDPAYTLVYVGDGSTESDALDSELRDIQRASRALHSSGLSSSRITAEETQAERRSALADFTSATIDGLVAIRVLDEGFDVPACRRAFLLASSRNERQYIQRRGRVLRKSPGKASADIYDFVALPCGKSSVSAAGKALVVSEATRALEFISAAQNREAAKRVLDAILLQYGISDDDMKSPEELVDDE